MQLVIGLLEAERVDLRLLLDDPIAALVRWSRDPGLQARARLVSGQALTAVELQERFLDEARRFADAGGYDGIVPRAAEIIALWEDTLAQLRAGNFEALATRVDWVLRRWVLDEARRRRPGLDWTSPELKHLDHLYASLDPASGLYWAYEQAGAVERWVSEDAIERFVHEPPEDTRAWGRAMLLRLAGADRVEDVDWDRIRFREVGRGYWPMIRTVHMPDPFGFTKAALADVLDGAHSFDDVLQALGASPPTYDATPTLAQWCAAQALEVRRTESQKGDDDDPAGTTTRGA
jgi:proteasome accessory factor A